MVLETVLRVYQSLNITGTRLHGIGNCAASLPIFKYNGDKGCMVLETVLRVYQSLNMKGTRVHGIGNCAASLPIFKYNGDKVALYWKLCCEFTNL